VAVAVATQFGAVIFAVDPDKFQPVELRVVVLDLVELRLLVELVAPLVELKRLQMVKLVFLLRLLLHPLSMVLVVVRVVAGMETSLEMVQIHKVEMAMSQMV
jgi:hypothetical protein